MAVSVLTFLILQGIVCHVGALSFANSYGPSMVLQRAPRRAVVWGYADMRYLGETVTVSVTKSGSSTMATSSATVRPGPDGLEAVWSTTLPPSEAGGPYIIIASLDGSTANLTDVLFGDVWLCSGQSNMEMETYKTINSSLEMEGAETYTNIRLFNVDHMESPRPLYDVISIKQPWTRPDLLSVSQFSSLCWSYGRKLHEHLQGIPIGLIGSYWGGTALEAWSSPQALLECYDSVDKEAFNKNDPSVLWNGMIHPLLNTTIYGAIWYQGEWNARRIGITADYECTFPAMIRDWRRQFHTGTNGQTDPVFPFGFVQLACQKKDWTLIDGFPHLRWKQTANKGSVPNDQMPNTFMAAAMDLSDMDSPYGANHPRDKTTISARLLLGARAGFLGEDAVEGKGPFPSAYLYKSSSSHLEIRYDLQNSSLDVRNKTGFEVCCSLSEDSPCEPSDLRWLPVPIVSSSQTSVVLDTRGCGSPLLGHRYAWRTNPCPYQSCALYSARSQLPAPVYVSLGKVNDDGSWHDVKV